MTNNAGKIRERAAEVLRERFDAWSAQGIISGLGHTLQCRILADDLAGIGLLTANTGAGPGEHEGITSIDDLAEHHGLEPLPLPDDAGKGGPEDTTNETCEHCGMLRRGSAVVNEYTVCHTGGAFPDCYRLITVYGEKPGSRNATRIVKDVLALLEEWNRLGRGDGIHGARLRAVIEGLDDRESRT